MPNLMKNIQETSTNLNRIDIKLSKAKNRENLARSKREATHCAQ